MCFGVRLNGVAMSPTKGVTERAGDDALGYFFELCGRADGREDHDVLSYKIETSSIRNCFSPTAPLTVLLGMKGVGKSTAFKIMTSDAGSGFLVLGFAPGSTRFKRLSSAQPGLLRERYIALFLSTCLTLLNESELVSAADRAGLSSIVAPLKSLMQGLTDAVLEGRGRIKGGSAFGFGVSLDLSADDEKKLDKFDRAAARKKLQSLANKGISVRLFIDDPEQSLPPGEDGQNSLIGLVLAANEINVNFRGVVGVTVLLKTHIYRRIAGNEELANIFPAQRGVLSWTEEELISAVDSRLSFARVPYNDAFAFDKASLKNRIISVLRNGPRDLFAWIGLAARASNGTKLKLDHFSKTTKEIGEYSMQQISTAYAETVPNTARLLQLVFSTKKETNWEALIKTIADMRINNKEFVELSQKSMLEQSSDYAKFFLEAGALQLVTKDRITEPFGKNYHESSEVGKQTRVKMHPLLAAALLD